MPNSDKDSLFSGNTKHKDFGTWLRERFAFRVQKLSVDAGFTCPNRDGSISVGGCAFCNNRAFSPSFCDGRKSITRQLEDGKAFFAHKYPSMKYLAYFQSFTNTYAHLDRLRAMYSEALAVPDVVGIVIGTRPDCVSEELLDYLEALSHRTFLIVEYGIESANDHTLRRLNRGHDFACSREAIVKTHQRGILTSGHVILGLPGEDTNESLRQAPIISDLPLDILKLHQLQVVRGTALANDYARQPFPLYTVDEYIDLIIRYVDKLRPDLVLERFVSQSPPDLVIAPKWGLKNHEFADLLNKRLRERAG